MNKAIATVIRKFLIFTICLVAVVIAAACSAAAQTPSPSPTATPDLPPPVQKTFDAPVRPMPSAERIGVNTDNQLSLTLDQAIEMALKSNNDIDASRDDTKIADYGWRSLRGVYDPLLVSDNFYEKIATPTASAIGGAVNGSVTQTRYSGSAGVSGLTPVGGGNYSVLFNPQRTTSSNTNSFLNPQFPSSLLFTFTQPLLRNRDIDTYRHSILIAKKNIEISDSQLQLKAITVVSSVEQAYWDLVFAMRNLQVQVETLRQAKDQLESNKRQVDRGVLPPIEIVASNAQIANFEQLVYVAQEAVTRAENSLKTMILPDRTSAEWSRPLTPVTPATLDVPHVPLENAVSDALKYRPELTQLDKEADINKIDQKFYRDQTKPQVDLVGTYNAQGLSGAPTAAAINPTTGLSRVPPSLVGGFGTSLENLAALRYPSYHIGVNISIPWGNHTAKANLGQSIVTGDKIANNRAQLEETIESDVRNALQALRSAESRLESATAARVAAEELYESEQRQFRAGTTTFYLVAQRQTDLLTARGRELQARTDLNKAISVFHRSIGTTLTVNNVSVTK